MFVCPNLGCQHCVLHERVTEEGPLWGREVGFSLQHHGAGGGPWRLPPAPGAAPPGNGPGARSPRCPCPPEQWPALEASARAGLVHVLQLWW